MDQTLEQREPGGAPPAGATREDEIRAAQQHETYTIAGVPRERVRQGAASATGEPCAECGVGPGQFHVPGCSLERCPACGEPVIACDCWYGTRPD
jgi:hypothetical protein